MDIFAHTALQLGINKPRAWHATASLQAIQARIAGLRTALPQAGEMLAHCSVSLESAFSYQRASEIGGVLSRLERCSSSEEIDSAIAQLRFHTGVGDAEELPSGVYRFAERASLTHRGRAGSNSFPLPGINLGKASAWVYFPRPGLFDDVLEPPLRQSIYPAAPADGTAESMLALLVRQAFEFLDRYCQSFATAIRRQLSAIILQPRGTRGLSANLGPSFPHAVFVNPWVRINDPHLLATSIAHEYLHQACWVLRGDKRLDGIRNPYERIRSPISGNEADVLSLFDGLMIFSSNLDYYNRLLREGWETSGNESVIRERRDLLRERIPTLLASLAPHAAEGTSAHRYWKFQSLCFHMIRELDGRQEE